jgi:hypothetical protein
MAVASSDVIHSETMTPNLALSTSAGSGTPVAGQSSYGMEAVGDGRMTPGAEAIIRAADSADPRPLWISVWGGVNTLAQASWHVRSTRSAAELERVVYKLRVYDSSNLTVLYASRPPSHKAMPRTKPSSKPPALNVGVTSEKTMNITGPTRPETPPTMDVVNRTHPNRLRAHDVAA